MKNIQKILLAVLALVLVGVIDVIIFVNTNDKNNTGNNSHTNNYTIQGEVTSEETTADTVHNHEHDHEHTAETVTKNDTGSGNSKTEYDKNSYSPADNNKTYDLKDAEVINTQKSSFGEVRLLSAKSDGKSIFLIEAEYKGKKFYAEYPAYYNFENIYYANVDGYYGDEVIIHASTGNDGIYENDVLKITSDGIIHLLNANNAFHMTTSFNTKLKENFNVEFSNKFTSFKKTINVKNINDENYVGSYWDKNGKVTEEDVLDHVWIDESFIRFEPQDVDNDGIYEIVCSQYTSLGDYSSCIGYAGITLKYNTGLKQFEIVNATFYPYSK